MADRTVVIGGLLDAWLELLPNAPELGAELLQRWSEPRRTYHALPHLSSALAALELLAGESREKRLAIWFHDAIHTGTPNGDEQASAELAEHSLAAAGLPRVEVHEVARLVLITAHHSPASADLAGSRVSDADLAILAGEPARYRSSVAALRAESPHLADRLWLTSRQAVLTALLGRPHLFHTGFGRLHWEQAARDNLSTELAELVS